MKIEVLGTGCAKCKALFENVKIAVGKSGKFVEIVKVEDIQDIMNYGVTSTPALVIDGEVKSRGKVCSPEEIMELMA